MAQYPDITPPTVEVSAIYPGANAKVVADTVAAPIEQQVNGVEGMMYMSSQCTNDGTYTLTVTFKLGTDLNIAQVLVQNRVALAQPILPDLVQRRGVSVKKKSPSVLMIVNLLLAAMRQADDNLLDLSNYATIQLRDEMPVCPASATSPTSASAITACASGSIRTKMAEREPDGQRHRHADRSSRTRRSRPGRSGSRRCRAARSSSSR